MTDNEVIALLRELFRTADECGYRKQDIATLTGASPSAISHWQGYLSYLDGDETVRSASLPSRTYSGKLAGVIEHIRNNPIVRPSNSLPSGG